jgi:glutathione reductase (NADPH)
MAEFDYDLFVIGAGSGGVRAARIAAGHGARVMVAEEFRMGGTCVIRGCVPKKLYVYASRFADEFEDAAGFGWTLPARSEFDWSKLVSAKEQEITRLSGIYRTNLEKAGVQIVDTRAIVEDRHTVRLLADNRTISAKYILVATGGTPRHVPEFPGMEHAITSNEVFDLPQMPRCMMIIGGGYIAVEFAGVFARLGTRVEMCMRADNVLRGFDCDMRDGVRDALQNAGVQLHFSALPVRVEKLDDGLHVHLSDGKHCTADVVMSATGRSAHTVGLGLEKAGVDLRSNGSIRVDGYSKTNVDSIYAVGDVTDRIQLTPVAIREGHAFADTVFGGKDIRVDHKDVATAVFTTPEIGTVGISEEEARRDYDIVDIYRSSFRPMKATLSGSKDRMIMKIIVDGKTDKVLGVHILGHDAGEMAQLLGIAIKMGATKSDFDATMAVHPTAAEELVTMRTRTERHER